MNAGVEELGRGSASPKSSSTIRRRHFGAEPIHRYLPANSNGQAANAAYRWDPAKACYVGEALEVLTLGGKEITAFMTPEILERFGLPDHLQQERGARMRSVLLGRNGNAHRLSRSRGLVRSPS
jgi:hypothetical protein